MKFTTDLVCPYCRNIFTVRVELESVGTQYRVFHCDIEDTPGCDRPFAVALAPDLHVQEYAFQFDQDETQPT